MANKNYLLCCDWGTSSFRLRLVHILDFKVVEEVVSQEGIAATFDAWKEQNADSGLSRHLFYRQRLKKYIGELAGKVSFSLEEITLVLSGMASSSIGMEEVPYAVLPFAVDGSQASMKVFDSSEDFPHDLILISGIRSQQDVMRGEETQLVGLLTLLGTAGIKTSDKIFIFPGTHSKHIWVRGEQLISFQTFMTGEIFNLMAKNSILRDSLDLKTLEDFAENEVIGFKLGIEEAGRRPILNGLFTVRTNQLFDTLTKRQNTLYLSGLLIGAELKQLQEMKGSQLVLCSSSNLFAFYRLALEELKLMPRTTVVPPDTVDLATIAGQIKVYQNQLQQTAPS